MLVVSVLLQPQYLCTLRPQCVHVHHDIRHVYTTSFPPALSRVVTVYRVDVVQFRNSQDNWPHFQVRVGFQFAW